MSTVIGIVVACTPRTAPPPATTNSDGADTEQASNTKNAEQRSSGEDTKKTVTDNNTANTAPATASNATTLWRLLGTGRRLTSSELANVHKNGHFVFTDPSHIFQYVEQEGIGNALLGHYRLNIYLQGKLKAQIEYFPISHATQFALGPTGDKICSEDLTSETVTVDQWDGVARGTTVKRLRFESWEAETQFVMDVLPDFVTEIKERLHLNAYGTLTSSTPATPRLLRPIDYIRRRYKEVNKLVESEVMVSKQTLDGTARPQTESTRRLNAVPPLFIPDFTYDTVTVYRKSGTNAVVKIAARWSAQGNINGITEYYFDPQHSGLIFFFHHSEETFDHKINTKKRRYYFMDGHLIKALVSDDTNPFAPLKNELKLLDDPAATTKQIIATAAGMEQAVATMAAPGDDKAASSPEVEKNGSSEESVGDRTAI